MLEVLATDVLERVEVARRSVAGFGSGDVVADHARVAPADGAFGDLDRASGLAHGRDEHLHDDRMAGRLGVPCPDREALEVRGHHVVERQATFRGQLGGVADLGVYDTVGGQVLRALGRDPDDRVALLHHADGVGEGLEIELEGLAVGASTDVRRQLVGIGRGSPS